jgi:hypothetical protein
VKTVGEIQKKIDYIKILICNYKNSLHAHMGENRRRSARAEIARLEANVKALEWAVGIRDAL